MYNNLEEAVVFLDKAVSFLTRFTQDLPEVWKDIDFYDIKTDRYKISSYGRIYDNKLCKFVNGYKHNSSMGYQACALQLNGNKYACFLIHRLVACAFCFGIHYGKIVNHIDSEPTCNYAYNLEWTTYKGNMAHASSKGRVRKGEEAGPSKMKDAEVIKVCELLELGKSYRDIIIAIGYDENDPNNFDLIGNIRRRIAWQHISKDYKFDEYQKRKFSDDETEKICQMIDDGFTNREIAISFGIDVSKQNANAREAFYEILQNIRKGKRYMNISSKYNFIKDKSSTTIETVIVIDPSDYTIRME